MFWCFLGLTIFAFIIVGIILSEIIHKNLPKENETETSYFGLFFCFVFGLLLFFSSLLSFSNIYGGVKKIDLKPGEYKLIAVGKKGKNLYPVIDGKWFIIKRHIFTAEISKDIVKFKKSSDKKLVVAKEKGDKKTILYWPKKIK